MLSYPKQDALKSAVGATTSMFRREGSYKRLKQSNSIRPARGSMDYGTHREISSISRENFSSGEKVHTIPSEKPSIRDVGIDNDCEIISLLSHQYNYIRIFMPLSHVGSPQQAISLSFHT